MIIRLNHALIVGAVGLFALAGCSGPQAASNSQPSPVESSAATSTTSTATTSTADAMQPSGDFGGLLKVISTTKTSVESGDFAQAKDQFSHFEDYWSKVEDGVKAKSSDTYNTVEDNADQVSQGLKGSQPDKDKILSALKTLHTTIKGAAKS
jgi:hypothetical protein